MSLIDTPLIQTVGHALDLTSFRQGLVTENIANIDTPGYHTRDINFRQELQRALGDDDSPVDATPSPREVPNLIERPDGNNVSIDRESLLMAQNQLQFQVGVAVLRAEFSKLQLAITEGNGQ